MEDSKNDIDIKICHVPGKNNNIADLLSRWETPLILEKNLKNCSLTMNICHSMDVSYLDHPSIPLFIRSVKRISSFRVNLKHIVDIPLLKSIVRACDFNYLGHIFKTCYLMAFWGFLDYPI